MCVHTTGVFTEGPQIPYISQHFVLSEHTLPRVATFCHIQLHVAIVCHTLPAFSQ